MTAIRTTVPVRRAVLRLTVFVSLAALVLAACAETSGTTALAAGDCSPDSLPLVSPGVLTVATGEPAFPPWIIDDDPSSKEGFEAAVTYAVAEEMGFADEDVVWIRTGFDEVIAPGPKDFDLNIQQYSITAERDEVVDFSVPYYVTNQALVAYPDSPVADTGTLFFDEIGEMTLGLQAKLLRFMETGTFRRVGGLKDIHVDTRIIAATNRNLKDASSSGHFREDLYYRLNVFSFTIPPLRERPEDIPVLARHFVEKSVVPGRRRWSIAPEVIERLERYDWPGNVRELRNVLERALILAEGDRIEVEDLPGNLQVRFPFIGESQNHGSPTLEQAEKLYIARLLKENDGNRAKVARILDISERNLYRKIKQYGL